MSKTETDLRQQNGGADNTENMSGWKAERVRALGSVLLPWVGGLLTLLVLGHLVHLYRSFQQVALSKSTPDPSVWNVWLIVPAAYSVGLLCAGFSEPRLRTISAVCGILVTAILGLMSPLALVLGILAVCAAGVVLTMKSPFWWRRRPDLAAAGFLGAVLAIAAYLRFHLLVAWVTQPLDPDAIGYLQLAERSSWWRTEFREPGFIWLLKFAHLFGGEWQPSFLRLAGVFLSLGSITTLFWFCYKRLGTLAAVVAALLYSVSRYMTFTGVRGLREDLIIALFIGILWACLWLWERRPTWQDYAIAAVPASALTLLRLSSLGFVLASLGITFLWAAYKNRLSWRRWGVFLVALAIVVLPVVPYMVHCKAKYGDSFYAINKDVRFYANVELAGKFPDMPTEAQVKADGYAGPPITMGKYLFHYHSLSELTSGAIKGLSRLLIGRSQGESFLPYAFDFAKWPIPAWVFCAHALALILMLLPGRRLIGAAVLLFHGPMLYLISFAWFDPRLVTVGFAGYYIAWGAAAILLVRAGAMALGQARPLNYSEFKDYLLLGTSPTKPTAKTAGRRPVGAVRSDRARKKR